MRRIIALLLIGIGLIGAGALYPWLRGLTRAEAPPPITPLVVVAPAPATATAAPPVSAAPAMPASAAPAVPTPARPTLLPATPPPRPTSAPSPSPAQVEVNGRRYDAYIPAASKAQQAYKYSCELDAAWVIFATFGYDISVDAMLDVLGVDERVEPYIEQTADGFIIHGGDIARQFSGDYRSNFLARSTGAALRRVFEHYGLRAAPVGDRAGVEAALRRGALVWMKTTVDFKPWRPAVWRTPAGAEIPTVLGNDHAVVAIGFSQDGVVIRDVLGPTSSNRQRPYEYEVAWETFLAAWGAQGFDGLAVERAP